MLGFIYCTFREFLHLKKFDMYMFKTYQRPIIMGRRYQNVILSFVILQS